MKRHVTIPIFVPHLGCPNDCSFCNQKKITGVQEPVLPETVASIAGQYLHTVSRAETVVEIGFFGGSFTGIPEEQQEALLSAAYSFAERGMIDGIRLSTRPDYIDEAVLKRLLRYGVTTVELGVQSMDDGVLKKNLRGHTAADTVLASEMIRSYGLGLGHQVMLGLPGDSADTARKSVAKMIALSPACARIYPTLVIRDTLLARWYREGSYTPLSLAEAVRQSKEALRQFREAGVRVIRVGLLNSESISTERDVLAGPFHPAFGELVESALTYDGLAGELSKMEETEGKTLQIVVHPRFVSTLVGCKKGNLKSLISQFMLRDVRVVQDESVEIGGWRMLCI